MDVAEMVRIDCTMPDPQYAKLWDSIITEPAVKDRLLRSAALTLRLRASLPFETTALHDSPCSTGRLEPARQPSLAGLPTTWLPSLEPGMPASSRSIRMAS